MTLTQIWGLLVICIGCPLLGGLPLIAWITYLLTGKQLAKLGTGNIGVQAAFYHGGKVSGILAVLSEASKGIIAVLLARNFFPGQPAWELIALIALVIGRYFIGKGAGTTNVFWGYIVHDSKIALLGLIIGIISFTVVRDRHAGRLFILFLMPTLIGLLHPNQPERTIAAMFLSGAIALIFKNMPDDLNLPSAQAKGDTKNVFRFFQGDKTLISLDKPLTVDKVGQKAATLSKLKRLGYPVPTGWVLPPGDDPAPLIQYLQPSVTEPFVVRSSAIGEDSETASAAGQYQTVLNVTNSTELEEAISFCIASYDNPSAVKYRQDRGLEDEAIAVLIQKQIKGVFSGVAFSRDPISKQGEAVIIEALPGEATKVVSGQITPEQYQVFVPETDLETIQPSSLEVIEGGDIPPELIKQVALLARKLEIEYHGIPQDIEWSYDGQMLWLLQSRPITTLIPIWTRKIAAEVIPGLIRPLTWSINRPLTCGVWGEIFTLVLGDRARGLDFNETATLHYSRAYFNATFLGQIFRRMGLPPESLEFLTRGAKFSKPPLASTLKNIPGLLRLVGRELSLEKDFEQEDRQIFTPTLNQLNIKPLEELSPDEILANITRILDVLKRITYYSIMGPLSAALRQAIFKVKETELDNSTTPEVASMRSLQQLAKDARHILVDSMPEEYQNYDQLFTKLAAIPEGQKIIDQLQQFLNRYGYLSEVATDIAVPRWKENQVLVQELFTQFFKETPPIKQTNHKPGGKSKLVQPRLNLKGKVTEIYSQFLAQLRWNFLALEKLWLNSGLLTQSGDIFFLELSEISSLIENRDDLSSDRLTQIIQQRRQKLIQNQQLETVPRLVYGNAPPTKFISDRQSTQPRLQGIGASAGEVEGTIKILRNLETIANIDQNTILVVPYTDSGWAPLLARAGGLIAEVGGRLSHGAIVAREYGIPAVMDIHNATSLFRDGQRVRINGELGIVEIL